jgi:hypothetical protein
MYTLGADYIFLVHPCQTSKWCPSSTAKKSQANAYERFWWAADGAVFFEPGLQTLEALCVALARHKYREAHRHTSFMRAPSATSFIAPDRSPLFPSLFFFDLFRPEAEGRREVYPPVLMYFLFSACVRTLCQPAHGSVFFLASMCFGVYASP